MTNCTDFKTPKYATVATAAPVPPGLVATHSCTSKTLNCLMLRPRTKPPCTLQARSNSRSRQSAAEGQVDIVLYMHCVVSASSGPSSCVSGSSYRRSGCKASWFCCQSRCPGPACKGRWLNTSPGIEKPASDVVSASGDRCQRHASPLTSLREATPLPSAGYCC